ncbi:MAG: putative NADH-cytochrome b5 reductase 1 [Piptocephalis tieghemiana]|nr:MAG: putative NADH-cytochrome b5 reductase 1 [Piptocephalis tieghemiana]
MSDNYFAVKDLAEHLIPYVAGAGGVALFVVLVSALVEKVRGPKAILSPTEFRSFRLHEKHPISHNTALYRFSLPDVDAPLGLPVGQHIAVSAIIDGKSVTRSYTPTSSNDDRGHFDLLIKSYPDGNVSRMFAQLEIGQEIRVRGPKGKFQYSPNMASHFVMVAGGTGITPMLQVIHAILSNPSDHTRITLIFANVREEDILLRSRLEDLRDSSSSSSSPDQQPRFSIHYVLNNPPDSWSGEVGFVTKDILARLAPPPTPSTRVLLCGPPPMVKAVSTSFHELGYDKPNLISKPEDQIFKF